MITKVFFPVGTSGAALIAPEQLIHDWPAVIQDCCGSGNGIGNIVVPETIFGLGISAACFIHDFCWEISGPSWDDFHQSNSIFLHNLLSLIDAGSENRLTRALRNYRAMTYYNAVDTIGAGIFQHLKGMNDAE